MTNISSVKVLSKGPKFASLQHILWGHGGANSNHRNTAGGEKWREIKWRDIYFMPVQLFYVFIVLA